jgi:hypothetical protein
MNIVFFDVVPTNIVRFFKGTVEQLRFLEPNINFYFLLEENDQNDDRHVKSNYPFASDIGYVQKRNLCWFKNYLLKNQINAVVTNAQRIPDDMMILAANELGIKSFMIQHGMYVPFMKRNLNFYLDKIGKTYRFLKYAIRLSRELGYGWFNLTYKYVKCFVFGANQIEENIPRDKLNVTKVYVYGDYWKDFHLKQFGYKYSQQLVVGYPDLEELFMNKSEKVEQGVCYISQTLVEDGRLDKNKQLTFFKHLVDSTHKSNYKLFIKLHPRSDTSLFEYGEGFEHVKLLLNEFPRVNKYIGHYSTLLAKGMIISGDVCIFEYENHPTPSYFEESSSKIIKNPRELEYWIKNDFEVNSKKIESYFECKGNVSHTIAKDILEEVNNKEVKK